MEIYTDYQLDKLIHVLEITSPSLTSPHFMMMTKFVIPLLKTLCVEDGKIVTKAGQTLEGIVIRKRAVDESMREKLTSLGIRWKTNDGETSESQSDREDKIRRFLQREQ